MIFQLAKLPLGMFLTYLFTTLIIIFVILMIRKFIRNKGSACVGSCAQCNETDTCKSMQYIKFKEEINHTLDEKNKGGTSDET